MAIRILLADDHAILAEGLRSLLERQPDMEVVATAADGREAVRQALETSPDVAVLDHAMPEMNGTEAARVIHDRCPQTRVLMLSMHSDPVHVQRALRAGAAGYIVKKAVAREIIEAIRVVHEGGRYLSRELADSVIDQFIGEPAKTDPISTLSSRERQVLQLLAEGRAVTEIAALLSLSPKTVETYRARMMDKLGIHDLASLVKLAIRHGLASLD